MQVIELIKKSEQLLEKDFSNRENREERFNIVKEFFSLKDTLGLTNNNIAKIVDLSATTISVYNNFDSYDEYCVAQSKRIAENKAKREEPELKIDEEDNTLEDILSELKTANYFLKEIRDLSGKRRIF